MNKENIILNILYYLIVINLIIINYCSVIGIIKIKIKVNNLHDAL